jgi:hypothetical protein
MCPTTPCASAPIQDAMCWSRAGDVQRIRPSASIEIRRSSGCTTARNGDHCGLPSWRRIPGVRPACPEVSIPWPPRSTTSYDIMEMLSSSSMRPIFNHSARSITRRKHARKCGEVTPPSKKVMDPRSRTSLVEDARKSPRCAFNIFRGLL